MGSGVRHVMLSDDVLGGLSVAEAHVLIFAYKCDSAAKRPAAHPSCILGRPNRPLKNTARRLARSQSGPTTGPRGVRKTGTGTSGASQTSGDVACPRFSHKPAHHAPGQDNPGLCFFRLPTPPERCTMHPAETTGSSQPKHFAGLIAECNQAPRTGGCSGHPKCSKRVVS